jgi:hypothetical protein
MKISTILAKLGGTAASVTRRRFTEVETDTFYKTKDRSVYADITITAIVNPYSVFTGRQTRIEGQAGREDTGMVKIYVDIAVDVAKDDHIITSDGTTYLVISKDKWLGEYQMFIGQVI